MSIFNKFKKITELSDREAYLAMVYGLIACDGEIDDDEVQALIHTAVHSKLFYGVSGDEFERLIGNVDTACEKNGLEWLFAEANRVLPMDLKKAAFVTAVDFAFADGSVGEAEDAYLQEIYSQLGIPEDFAAKALEVMEVRHSA